MTSESGEGAKKESHRVLELFGKDVLGTLIKTLVIQRGNSKIEGKLRIEGSSVLYEKPEKSS